MVTNRQLRARLSVAFAPKILPHFAAFSLNFGAKRGLKTCFAALCRTFAARKMRQKIRYNCDKMTKKTTKVPIIQFCRFFAAFSNKIERFLYILSYIGGKCGNAANPLLRENRWGCRI